MSMDYVRRVYGVPAKRGMRVESIPSIPPQPPRQGIVTRCTCYVWVRHDGEKHARAYHPTSLRYFGKDGEVLWPLAVT